MKRLFFAFLVIVISSTAQAKYSGGSGTTEDPYQIANASDLLALAAYTNDYDANFIMTADINLSSYIFTTAVIACDINNSNYGHFDGIAFVGNFDGAGHKVINMKIDTYGEGNDFLGLFGYIYLGNVKNLGVDNISIISGNESFCLGGLAGVIVGRINRINNCSSTGSLICGDSSDIIGGLVGGNSGFITNCSSAVNVSGMYECGDFGGLVGQNWNFISGSYSTGNVNGYHLYHLGGLVGMNWFGVISDCYSTGDVNGGGSSITAGGLAAGGGSFINCYSTGNVTGARDLAGLVFDGDVTSSYFLITSGPNNGYGIPLSEAEMKQKSSFAGWDFIETWGIEDNQTCPFLKLTYSVGDLNRDKSIDFFDLAILASHWLEGP